MSDTKQKWNRKAGVAFLMKTLCDLIISSCMRRWASKVKELKKNKKNKLRKDRRRYRTNSNCLRRTNSFVYLALPYPTLERRPMALHNHMTSICFSDYPLAFIDYAPGQKVTRYLRGDKNHITTQEPRNTTVKYKKKHVLRSQPCLRRSFSKSPIWPVFWLLVL